MKTDKRLRAAKRYAALMAAYWDGAQDELPEPRPVDLNEIRLYDETWQERWNRLTGRMPDAIDYEGQEDHEEHEARVRRKSR